MTTWIALLRGINIGGHHKLPMKALVALLEGLGATDVRTYIQSGNAVFRHPQDDPAPLADEIGTAIEAAHGFRPDVLLLTRGQMERAAAANPFPQGDAEPKAVAVYFLARPPDAPDLDGIERLRAGREAFVLDGATAYFYGPDGFGRSKLAARAEALLGVPATARNWRTVNAVLELARALE